MNAIIISDLNKILNNIKIMNLITLNEEDERNTPEENQI